MISICLLFIVNLLGGNNMTIFSSIFTIINYATQVYTVIEQGEEAIGALEEIIDFISKG
jgi:hypothetical protein